MVGREIVSAEAEGRFGRVVGAWKLICDGGTGVMCTVGQFDLGLHRGQCCCHGVPEYNICAEFVNFSALRDRAQLTDRGDVSPTLLVFVKMGSTSWRDNIQQALLIGLVVQIVVSILCVFWAFLRASWKKRMARRATGESMAESDVEMGTVNINGSEGATIPDNTPHVLTANSGLGDDGKLEYTEDTADTRASTPEIPTVDHLPKVQYKNFTEDRKRRASVPVLVDVSHPQQVEVLAGKES